jgi:phosphoglycerol transferase MdoB-like AlkP superfamily enzyme
MKNIPSAPNDSFSCGRFSGAALWRLQLLVSVLEAVLPLSQLVRALADLELSSVRGLVGLLALVLQLL